MTALLNFQRAVARAVMQPLTSRDTVPRRPAGSGTADAIALVKPNSRLSSLERLEIYSRSYWSRVLDALAEDFPGVRAVVGAQRFDRMRRAYLAECPSQSFTLRNLGSRLPAWIEHHSEFAGPNSDVALDMARLEWAHIESFDAAEHARPGAAQIAALDAAGTLHLQPHLRWIAAGSAVDDLLIEARHAVERAVGDRRALPATGAHSAPRAFSKARLARARAEASPAPLYLAIHRHELVVHYKRIDREMFRLLEALARPLPMGDALEFAYADSSLTPEQCGRHAQESFALFASLGWFCNPASCGRHAATPLGSGSREKS